MRVLIWMDASNVPGGHKIQAECTAAAIGERGLDVQLTADGDASLRKVDIVHGIGADPRWLRRAREAGVPVAMSTIYWSTSYLVGLPQGTSRIARNMYRGRIGASVLRRGLAATALRVAAPAIDHRGRFESADLLLPNSDAEAQTVIRELGVTTRIAVVPNGADPELFSPPEHTQPRRGVAYMGRIEPHKNQLALIRLSPGLAFPSRSWGHLTPTTRRITGSVVAQRTARPNSSRGSHRQNLRVSIAQYKFMPCHRGSKRRALPP